MVVFFDIDGTLIDNDTQIIPPSAVAAVEELGRRGHLAVVNTGRPYTHIDPRIRQMAFGGWVCGCGMEIRLDHRWLQRKMPEPSVCAETRALVRECGMQAVYEAQEGALYLDGPWSTHPIIEAEARQMQQKGFRVEQMDDLEDITFMKFVTYDAENCRREEFIARAGRWFEVIRRDGTMLELMLKGCSKAGGMLALLEHLNIPRSDTLAIGDSTNDLPMFSVAEHTVCMGGGMEELKARAEYITDSVLDDGIAKALRHYNLI